LLHLTGGFFWAGYNLCSANLLYRMAPAQGNSTFFAFWAISTGLAAGVGSLTGGILAKNVNWIMQLLPFSFDSGYKLIFIISVMFRFIPLFLIRHVREEKGMPFTQAVRVLRNVRAWASIMGFSSALHYFLPGTTPAPKSSPYWPIWGRKITEGTDNFDKPSGIGRFNSNLK
jgi:hypothetical protein